MAVNFRENEDGGVSIDIKGIVDDSYAITMFIQKIVAITVKAYLRKRIVAELNSDSVKKHGHSHWLEEVFLSRASSMFNLGFNDDYLLSRNSIKQLNDKLSESFDRSRSLFLDIALIERDVRIGFFFSKKILTMSFSEKHKEVDKLLQETLKEVLMSNAI